MTSRPYIDFYEDHQIIPVRQDLSDMAKHLRRRDALYRQLGLLPALVRGRSVLEIGPGTGDNAVHTAGLGPARYVLVDGNSQSIAALEAKMAAGVLPATAQVVRSDFLSFETDQRFDVVLCEGLLPAQSDPAAFLRRLAALVAEQGVLVVTTVSHISYFPEMCRRLVMPVMRRHHPSMAALVGALAAFFAPDLHSLPGMSRLHEDWVLDQIIHPYGTAVAFPLAEAVRTLDATFEAAGTSPRFLTDWRWYKSVVESPQSANDWTMAQMDGHALAMIDYRVAPQPTDPALARGIEGRCRDLWAAHVAYHASGDDVLLPPILDGIAGVADLLPAPYAGTATAIRDFLGGFRQLLSGAVAPDFGAFPPLFGRGQQYLMLTRP